MTFSYNPVSIQYVPYIAKYNNDTTPRHSMLSKAQRTVRLNGISNNHFSHSARTCYQHWQSSDSVVSI